MLTLRLVWTFLYENILKHLLLLIAVVFGTAVFYLILNLASGLNSVVLRATAETDSHINITYKVEFDPKADINENDLRNNLFAVDHNITDIAFYNESVFKILNNDDFANEVFSIRGVDFKNEGRNIDNIYARVSSKFNKFPEGVRRNYYEVAIGHLLANKIFPHLIDYEEAVNSYMNIEISGIKYRVKVVAVFYANTVAGSMMLTTINDYQLMFNTNSTSHIAMRVKDPLKSENTAYLLENYFQELGVFPKIVNWSEGKEYAVNALYVEDVSIIIIQAITAISIALGISNMLSFMVKEKLGEIGILKAMGYKDRYLALIFFIQSLIITLIGLYLGLKLGNLLSKLFMLFFKRPDGNALFTVHRSLKNNIAYLTFGVIFTSNMLASLIPTLMVKRLKVIEVIKHE